MTASLRRRIFVGSLLWTIGMILLASAAFSVVMEMHRRPGLFFDVHGFLQAPLTLALATLCLVAGALGVRRGLSRIDTLRSRLAELHQGQGRRLDGDYPAEIQPLVNDLNSLLETRERAVQRAIAKAGDLAHGLKTPLAILAQDADRAAVAGETDLAASIRHQVTRMHRQIEYHLAHARASASGAAPGARVALRETAEGLKRTLVRLHADRRITIDLRMSADLSARVEREDLEEMLGNLLDNGCKWARATVIVEATATGSWVELTVDDDGPGLADELRELVLKRGVRADEAAPGSGLGLAIVRELAEVYSGSIALERSPEGGVRAKLRLPA
jgi:signal transduction histidine kinase